MKDTGIFLAKEYELKQKLRQICIYPVFLLCVLAIVIMLMIFLVIPAFADIFQRMHIDLPYFNSNYFIYRLKYKGSFYKIMRIVIDNFYSYYFGGAKR